MFKKIRDFFSMTREKVEVQKKPEEKHWCGEPVEYTLLFGKWTDSYDAHFLMHNLKIDEKDLIMYTICEKHQVKRRKNYWKNFKQIK